MELFRGSTSAAIGGYYESFAWSSPDKVLQLLIDDGFAIAFRSEFAYPWTGEHVCLRAP